MKRQWGYLAALGSFGLAAATAQAETLLWDPNSEPDLAGYKVYYGEVGSSTNQFDVGNTTSREFTDLAAGRRYFFYVTAYNDTSESIFSERLEYTVPSGGTSNQPPTIAAISDMSVAEDAQNVRVNISVWDPDTAANNLAVTASSSNQSLLPNGRIAVSTTGTNRVLTFSPAADQSGTANVTVSVSDGQSSATDTFQVTVTPVNDAPTMSSVPNQTIQMNNSSGPISFSVGDKETSAGSLTVAAGSSNPTLVPQTALAFGGSGANRTLTITPARDQTGQAVITLQVSDGNLSSTTSFTLTVERPAAPTLVAEDFEGPGYQNSGWFEVNQANEKFTFFPLQGSYSLQTQRGSQAYRELNGATNQNLSFLLSWRELSATHTIVDFNDASGRPVAFLWASAGQLNISHGTARASKVFAYAPSATYRVWLEWSSGPAGEMSVFLSTNDTKPSSPMLTLSSGTGGAAERVYFGGAAPDSPSLVFDRIRMSNGPL